MNSPPELFYIIGIPGSGKSTLVKHILLGKQKLYEVSIPFCFIQYNTGLVYLGKPLGLHPGTDTLSMSIQPKLIEWIKLQRVQTILGEGDRLANVGFFNSIAALEYNVHVIHLIVPEEVAAERRSIRKTNQDTTWIQGRITKVKNLVEKLPPEYIIRIDGTLTPEQQTSILLKQFPSLR